MPDARVVRAPAGISWVEPEEMTLCCGAGTTVDEVLAELAPLRQTVAMPPGGTVGGALAAGQSGIRRLGDGPMRDVALQLRYVSAAGAVVKAGGPTVKNVSGFDLCRLLVGSHGTLGFVGEVIMRTRPIARSSQWYAREGDPWELLARLYRPTSLLWDGVQTFALLEGHEDDRSAEARDLGLQPCAGPPELPTGGRRSLPPGDLRTTMERSGAAPGEFVAEVGVGIVHTRIPSPPHAVPEPVRLLHARVKHAFDPANRLNPGRSVLDPGP